MKSSAIMDIVTKVADFLFRILQVVAGLWFRIAYRKPGNTMPCISNPLLLDSATVLASKIRNKEVTSVEVVKAFINRIREVNPMLNFMIDERFEEALNEAREIDEKIASGLWSKEEMEEKKPFLGVPFTFKQCISLTGFRNTAGLYSRRNVRATEDADVILHLRDAGAVPLASTNVSELCLWWESFNPVHGRTSNPYNTNHTVGGSSGGEGCIQACAASPIGMGSDIGGSVRIPSFFNGVFGHKPTNGIGSLKGHYPYPRYPSMSSYLVIGPMCRYATDLLPLYKVLVKEHVDELQLNEKVDLTTLKYYYMDDDTGGVLLSSVDSEIKFAIQKIVKYFNKKYRIAVEKVELKKLRHSMMVWFATMKPEGDRLIPTELANNEGSVNVFMEILKFIFGTSHHTLPVLGTGALEYFGMTHGDSEHTYFINKCQQLKKEFQDLLGSNGIFFYPTLPSPAPHHIEPITKPFDVAYCGIFNCLGFPVTQCPMGVNLKGLPIGVQVVANEKMDRLTIAVAEELEKAFGGWVPPEIEF